MANAHIISFIQSLNEEETRSAKEYIYKVLSAYKGNSIESKQLLLFNYVTANRDKTISESEISKITGTKNTASLKLRLYEIITEALTLNKHLSKKAVFNNRDLIILKLKKKLLLLRILFRTPNQKRFDTVRHLLNEIIKESKENELYNFLIEALTSKKYIIGLKSGTKEFDKINKEIIFYEYCSNSVHYASDCYYKVILNDNLAKTLSQKEMDFFFQVSIKQMEIDHKKTNSQEIAYFLHIIRFALCERQKNYTEAVKLCNKLMSIIQKSKVVYRKERIGGTLLNLSLFKNHLGNYEAAAIDAKNAQGYYNRNSFDHTIAKEQEFYAFFYGNKTQEAFKISKGLLKHLPADLGKFRRSKFIFYHCCTLFALKKYEKIYEILKTPLEIEKDVKWNVSLRLFKIMLFIELHRIDEAARSLESLRKYIERSKSKEIKARDLLIVKTLRELEKENFEFRPTNTTVIKMLHELSAKDSPVSWEHYTQELVPFHKWLEGKKL